MIIAGHKIGAGNPPFLVGEASVNHCGSIERALEMVRVAKECGVDAVKFQTFHADDVCPPDQMYTYKQMNQFRGDEPFKIYEMVTEPRINIFRRCELPEHAWWVIKKECERNDILFMSTPEAPRDLDLLLRVGIPAIKLGSDNCTNLPMLRYCARDDVGLPIILSTGMSDHDDIWRAINIIGHENTALLVCTSQYPCPPSDCNVGRITFIQDMIGGDVGFSDHTIGSHAAVMAVAVEACILEKHFTLDENLPGPEHNWAANPAELKVWADDVRMAYTMLGDGIVRPTAAELALKAQYQRSHA